MRKLMLLMAVGFVMSTMAAPAMAQEVPLGDSSAVAYDPAEYERSEINPNGPCFDPEVADNVVGVPVENLANAYINRNDPVGTPLVSPLDSNNSGIACDALTQEEAAAIDPGGQQEDIVPGTTGNCAIEQAFVPEINGCVQSEGLPDPLVNQANAVVFDADTGEELGILKELVDLSADPNYSTVNYCGSFPLIDGTTAQDYYDGVQGEIIENVPSGVANAQEQAILDPNGDGLACTPEDLAFTGNGVDDGTVDDGIVEDGTTPPVADQPVAPEQPVADDDMIGLPDTGGPALLLPIAGLLALMGLGGLVLLKRR